MTDAGVGGRLQDGNDCLEGALFYLSLGWSPLAICPPDHVGVGRDHGKTCSSPGKRPLGLWKEFQERLPTEEELRDRWHQNPNANVGIALGAVSGLVRIDIEGEAGEIALQRMSEGDLPGTLESSSGCEVGGRGLLYAIPPGFRCRTTSEQQGKGSEVRIQATGAQTVLPPSRHASGRRYEWKPGRSPQETKTAPAPAWLLRELTPDSQSQSAAPVFGELQRIAEGGRDDFLTRQAGLMRRHGASAAMIARAIAAMNEAVCDPPLSLADIERIARSVGRYQPEPIDDGVPIEPLPKIPVPDWPIEIFPPVIQRFVREVSQSLSCPMDFPALFVLGVAATAIGTSRAIYVSRKWRECARLYLALVADPGEAKSPALDIVCEPLYERQEILSRDFEFRKQQYEDEMAHYEAERQMSRKPGSKVIVRQRPSKPRYPHVYTSDATTEAMACMLQETPRGFAMMKDEVTSWVSSMNQYKAGGKGNDRQFWLSCWSGGQAKVDRKNQGESGPVIVHRPFVTVFGNIQPDMIGMLCDERAREDGFIHRILFSYPASKRWPERIGEPLSEDAEESWRDAVNRLYQLEPEIGRNGTEIPTTVYFDPEGQKISELWFAEHARERNAKDFPLNMVGPWAKMKAYYYRIALVLHFLAHVTEGCDARYVGVGAAMGAWLAIDYFKAHCRRTYQSMKADEGDKRMQEIIEWIKEKGQGKCKPRDLQRAHFAKKASHAKSIIKDLEDRGIGSVQETGEFALAKAVATCRKDLSQRS